MTKKDNSIKPKLSVIICCYGGEETIEAALISLLKQDISNDEFEVIIVDDGSKDNSSQIISNFLKEKINPDLDPTYRYFRKKNEGLSLARNYGIDKSNADLVVFIDEDALAYPNYVSTIIEHFNHNPEVNCLGGEIELYNDDLKFARIIQDSIFSLYMKDSRSIIGTNMAYRKSFLLEVGKFQPEFTYRGDETALFAKSKDLLVKGRNAKMKVKHFQPSTFKAWLKTRFENGFFRIGIDFFIGISRGQIYSNMIKRLLVVILPYLVFVSFGFLLVDYRLTLLILIFCLLLFLKKFFFNGLIPNTIKEFRVNRNGKTKFSDELYISYLVIRGIFAEDIGYLKGYKKFKNFKWSD